MTQGPGVTSASSDKRDGLTAILHRWLPLGSLLLRVMLGGIFLWRGLSKLRQPYDFLSAVYNYELVEAQVGLWLARVIPWLELAIGLCLVLRVWEKGAWVWASMLLAFFMLAQVSALHRGLLIPCGCSSNTSEIVSFRSALATSFLFIMSLIGLWLSAWSASGYNPWVRHGASD
jgi:uncharacterized membrane protein YphA (DoxX/SURF4 family)